ncbi:MULTISPECIES: hypothetical protein [unclassified Massilia]|uniref:hypothetical protein n=1 Tax=unclassified Massilia TaxID=2609279 RepID=UPI001E457203|nr:MULTISPECIES: hypothetical protein [unclassified Massilia]
MMTWVHWHAESERLASEAEVHTRRKDATTARSLYLKAAEAENQALLDLAPNKPRTLGITAVSAASLWFKARSFKKASQLCYLMLGRGDLPDFAVDQLKALVQAIWIEESKSEAEVAFLPGQVNFSVKGGEVVVGGAPLDLIVDKVKTIQSIFYRTIEESQDMPLRRRGDPKREVQDACRAWLFQMPPGSYQFSVAIQEPPQRDFFKTTVDPDLIAERFLTVLRASAAGDAAQLELIIPDADYRSTFLKLARNLAPTGTTFGQMEISSALGGDVVELRPENRKTISAEISRLKPKRVTDSETVEETLRGVLRAVNLDKDWIEVASDVGTHHIVGLAEALDDVIGPMVNRRVVVKVRRDALLKYKFDDIELDE